MPLLPPQLLPGNVESVGTALAADACPWPPRTERSSRPLPPSWGCLFLFSVFLSEITQPVCDPFQKWHQPASKNSPREGPSAGVGLDLRGPTASLDLRVPPMQTKGLEGCSLGTLWLLNSRILCLGASHSANSHDSVPSRHVPAKSLIMIPVSVIAAAPTF